SRPPDRRQHIDSCWAGSDNSAGSWTSMQEWILRLRKRGLAVLLVHHSGKSGEQRGTSRREDVLDTVIGLRRPEDYEPQQGARFEVHVEKSRAYFGDAGRPFEANLASTPDGRGLTWLACDLKPSRFEEAAALFRNGVTVRAVAAQLGSPGRAPAGSARRRRRTGSSIPTASPRVVVRMRAARATSASRGRVPLSRVLRVRDRGTENGGM